MNKTPFYTFFLVALAGIIICSLSLDASFRPDTGFIAKQTEHHSGNAVVSVPDTDYQANQRLEIPEVVRISLPVQLLRTKLANNNHCSFILANFLRNIGQIEQQCWKDNLRLKSTSQPLHIVFRKLLI